MLTNRERDMLGDVKPGRMLKILDILCADTLRRAHQLTQARITMHRAIAKCAEAGRVALVRNGRDCDGVQYSGDVCYVEANWRAVCERVEHDLDNADGPMYHVIDSPSAARKLTYESRDLVAEAFEDGHAHSIHASF